MNVNAGDTARLLFCNRSKGDATRFDEPHYDCLAVLLFFCFSELHSIRLLESARLPPVVPPAGRKEMSRTMTGCQAGCAPVCFFVEVYSICQLLLFLDPTTSFIVLLLLLL